MNKQNTNSWEQRDMANVFHGFSDLGTLNSNGPVVLTHGEGIHVFDVHGKSYMDANSGLWNNVAGFNHQGLIDTICEQAKRFPGYHSFFGRIADTTVALSEKLVEVSPFEEGKVFYTNSGSEANDSMVKMLWMLHRRNGQPQRRKIISRLNAYHGVTAVSASMTGKAYNEEFGLPLPGFLQTDCPHYWRFGLEGETELEFSERLARNLEELIIKEGSDTIAGMWAEPVMGAGGVIPPSEGYFEAIRPILRTPSGKRAKRPVIVDQSAAGWLCEQPALASRCMHSRGSGHSWRRWQSPQMSPGPRSQIRTSAIPGCAARRETIPRRTSSGGRTCATSRLICWSARRSTIMKSHKKRLDPTN